VQQAGAERFMNSKIPAEIADAGEEELKRKQDEERECQEGETFAKESH
jgi:hypothetical protein